MTTRVAVIGSGMAGLTATCELRGFGCEVTLFEAREDLGMSAHGLSVDDGRVDVPLRVVGEGVWQETLALARHVGVEAFPVQVNVSCNWLDGQTWFRNTRMPLVGWPMVGSWRFAGLRSLRLARGMVRLSTSMRTLSDRAPEPLLEEFVRETGFDPLFWRGLILPMLATICTCDEQQLKAWPAGPLLALLSDIVHSSRLLRLEGGTAGLARALAGGVESNNGSIVTRVRQQGDGVEVRNAEGRGGWFDYVIVATQANQLDFLDREQFGDERARLARVPYVSGELVVHRDTRFMPCRKRNWTALNFLMDRQLEQAMFTVWVNRVEPSLAGQAPVFQTWNPIFEVKPSQVIRRVSLQRAVVNRDSLGVPAEVRRWHDQPGRRVFYCGSWAHEGVPLLETAVRSAQAAAERVRSTLRA